MTKEEYISELELKVSYQESQLSLQAEKIVLLEEKIEQLLLLLQKQGIKKDSRNSHLPPSKDLFSSKKSLRASSSRKSGGQPGHEGYTLKMSASPDVIVDLKSTYCSVCGNELQDATFVLKAKRQVVDIPPIPSPVYTEYDQYSCLCSNCHYEQVADFPSGVIAPTLI